MKKLGLIGKNISHSKSPEIYKKLISPQVTYDLLDFLNEKELPAIKELAKVYEGLNITSPYKEAYVKEVELSCAAQKIGAINCLKFVDGKIFGENTDYHAVRDIIQNLSKQNGRIFVSILGDGVMSRLLRIVLEEEKIPYQTYSRKKNSDFKSLDLSLVPTKNDHFSLIVNTCSREYVYTGNFPNNFLFWDFNYNFEAHQKRFPNSSNQYRDGWELLIKQAEYAVLFWSGKI